MSLHIIDMCPRQNRRPVSGACVGPPDDLVYLCRARPVTRVHTNTGHISAPPFTDRCLRWPRSYTSSKPPEIGRKPLSGATDFSARSEMKEKHSDREPPFKQKPCCVVNVPKRNVYILCTSVSATAKKIVKSSKNKGGGAYFARYQSYKRHIHVHMIIRCCLKLDGDGSNLWSLRHPKYKGWIKENTD